MARAISYVGDAVALTALLLHVEATAGVGVAVSALLLAHSIPNSLLGPIAGTIADRIDQRTLMIATDLGRAVLFVVIAATMPAFPVLVGLMVIVAILETGFRPAGRSAIPALVGRSDLMTANAWLVTALNAGFATGPLIGGLLVAWVGVPGALYANAATFVLSAVLLIRLPHLRSDEDPDEERLSFFATVREGLAFARRHAITRAVVIGLVVGVAAAGLDNVALVFLATREFAAGPAGFGLLESAFGIGMIASSLWLVRKTDLTAGALFVIGWFGTGLSAISVGLSPIFALAVVAHLIGGSGNAVTLVGSDTLIQQNVPKAMLGRAFGITQSAPFVGSLVAFGIGGVLVDTFGARVTFLVSGIVTLFVSIFVMFLLRAATADQTALQE